MAGNSNISINIPPVQMVVPRTTIMAKGTINRDHGQMHPTMSQPSYIEGHNKQKPFSYAYKNNNRDIRRPYFSAEYGLLRFLFIISFLYGRSLQKWSLFTVTWRP